MSYVTKPIPVEKPSVKFKERPWGNFSQYVFNQDSTVSLITVNPGQRLSLQSHTARAELWVVLDDGAVIQIGDQTKTYRRGDEVWIPANAKHRLASAISNPVRVLEIAFGNWQQREITRYEDADGQTKHEE